MMKAIIPTIEVYSSIDCLFAYLSIYRLLRVLPEYEGQVQFQWKALSLEFINKRPVSRQLFEVEYKLFQEIEPDLPLSAWGRPDWEWPVTMWPAFEALACAEAQGPEAGLTMSWNLRHAFYEDSRCISLRHELFGIAEEIAPQIELDLKRFQDDWDNGIYKKTVLAESWRGWHELKVESSATYILPSGKQLINPGLGEIDIDEEHFVLRSFTPYPGDPLDAFRAMLDEAIQSE